jgi:AcrR family transcriptional regulator
LEIGIITRNSRQRILEAANALARDVGPGNLSLDAVAQRAGLSKGGLLYNFPTKAKLMEALVEMHISQHRQALETAQLRHRGKPNALSLAVVDTFLAECGSKQKPASGVLAAIAEDPSFIPARTRGEAEGGVRRSGPRSSRIPCDRRLEMPATLRSRRFLGRRQPAASFADGADGGAGTGARSAAGACESHGRGISLTVA